MLKAIFDKNGFPQGFYNTDAYDDISFIPEKAVEITEDQYREFLDNIGHRKWNNGVVVEYEPPQIELSDFKITLSRRVDRDAERHHRNYMRLGVSQSMIYQEKINQAAEYSNKYTEHLRNPETTAAPVDDEYPHLKAGLGIDGDTLIEVAENVTFAYAEWQQNSAEIETIRLKSKADIENAKTREKAQNIYDTIKWPEGS